MPTAAKLPNTSKLVHEANQNEPLRISIALATYNGGKYLRAQLESLARQTVAPFELVITDDGSTDDTFDVISWFASTVTFPVRAFRNEQRLGFADNFLRAASLCTGDLIAFCDQDDVWCEEKLATCAAPFADDEVALCIHDGYVWDGSATHGLFPDWGETSVKDSLTMSPLNLLPGFCMVFRSCLCQAIDNRTRFRSFATDAELVPHDQWIWFLAAISGKIATINKPLVFYRQHLANTYGAPVVYTWKQRLAITLMPPSYKSLSEIEASGAGVAYFYAERVCHPIFQRNAVVAGARLLRMSRLHLLRTKLHSASENFATRCRSLWEIVRLGGYRRNETYENLGYSALIKDIFIGLPGVTSKLGRLFT